MLCLKKAKGSASIQTSHHACMPILCLCFSLHLHTHTHTCLTLHTHTHTHRQHTPQEDSDLSVGPPRMISLMPLPHTPFLTSHTHTLWPPCISLFAFSLLFHRCVGIFARTLCFARTDEQQAQRARSWMLSVHRLFAHALRTPATKAFWRWRTSRARCARTRSARAFFARTHALRARASYSDIGAR